MLVDAWLPRAARSHPDRPAVNAMTYGELARRAAEAAPRRGTRVGIALPPGEEFAIALHACLLGGAVAVPIDLRLTEAERPAVDVLLAELPEGIPVRGDVRGRLDLEQTAVVVHTSGTTSAPKPVQLRFGNWLWSALGSGVALGVDPEERWLSALPLSHVGGLSILLRSVVYGTTAIVHERFDTDRVLDALLQEDGPTIVSLVPTTLQRLLDAGLREPPALRWALLGGAPATTALHGRAAAAGVPVATTYGLTETCSQVTTLGAPLFCTRVRMAGDGEILVSGPTVAPSAGPVLGTGDLGEWRPDGALRVAGRKADTIVSGGENVAPAEVEAVLEAHPDVVEAAVHGRADPEWGEAVVATVVADPDLEAEELRAWCAARLATFKVPKEIAFTVALPRTPSGKVARKDLR